ncbi:MAG: hypothetical protein ACI8WB_000579 [Phenylobacterium sp.]|jgi:hypothetical protein
MQAYHSIEQAQQWLVKYKNDSGYQTAQEVLLLRWFRTDFEKAAQTLAQLDDSSAKQAFISLIVRQWYSMSSDQTLTWVYSLKEGKMRDTALGTIAISVNSSDPRKAADIASFITDPRAQQKVLVAISY